MLRSIILSSIRYLRIHGGHLWINQISLIVGVFGLLNLFYYIQFQLSYDIQHKDHERIYRVSCKHDILQTGDSSYVDRTSLLLRPLLLEFPEIQKVGVSIERPTSIGDYFKFDTLQASLANTKLLLVNPDFIEIFVNDNLSQETHSTDYAVFREKYLRSFLNGHFLPPEISIVRKNDKRQRQMLGQYFDGEYPTHFDFDLLVGSLLEFENLHKKSSWGSLNYSMYIKLENNVLIADLENHINNLLFDRNPESWYKIHLQEISDIQLNRSGINIAANGNYQNLLVIITLTTILFFVCAINFCTSLITLRFQRAKESFVRSLLAGSQSPNKQQFLFEVVSYFSFAMIFGASLFYLFHDEIANLLGWSIIFSGHIIMKTILLVFLIFLTLTVLATFLINRVHSWTVAFNSRRIDSRSSIKWSSTLIVIQIASSIFLFSCSIAIGDQLAYVKKKDQVYLNSEGVISISPNSSISGARFVGKYGEILKNDLMKIEGVESVVFSNTILGSGKVWNNDGYNVIFCTSELIDVLRLNLIHGRWFHSDENYEQNNCVINEMAAKSLGLEESTTIQIEINGSKRKVIGVVEDFHFRSFYNPIEPLVILLDDGRQLKSIAVRTSSLDIYESIKKIDRAWKEILPLEPMQYTFLRDNMEILYREEINFRNIINLFSLILIATLGLGLIAITTFNSNSRIPEVAIRKVFGASVSHLVLHSYKEIVILLIISSCLSIPLATLFLTDWLDKFHYHINLNPMIFVNSIIMCLGFCTLITINVIWKSARRNPIESLRQE